ncbi:ATP-binding protein [Flammeovirgaceae bacterium]
MLISQNYSISRIFLGRKAYIDYVRYSFFFFVLFLGAINAWAQSADEDLLADLKANNEVIHDSLYYELFRISYHNSDLEKAKTYAHKSLLLSEKYKHLNITAKSCRALGLVYHKLENFDSSKFYYYKGIEVASRASQNKLLVYLANDFGRLYENLDVYDSALRYYNLSLEKAVKIGPKEDEAFALNNIGLVFYYIGNNTEALENLNAAVDIKRKLGIKSLDISLMNIALIYNEQGRYDQAIQLLKEVEAKCSEGCGDYLLADLYYDLGYAYFEKNQLSLAYDYLVTGYDWAQKSGNKKVMAHTLYHFGLYQFDKSDYNQTRDYLDEALKLANEMNLRRLKRDIYLAYIRLYEKTKNLELVVEFQNKYISIKDDIFNEQMATNLKEIQLDVQRKQSEVIILQKDTEIKRVRLITTLIGVISVLLVVVSILIYRSYRASHRMKKMLEKEIKNRTGELVKSNADLTQMTQEYDQLVYRASHDIRGPLATLMGLTNIAKQDYEEPLRVRDYLGKIESTALGLNQTLSQLMETNRIRNLPICIEEVDMGVLVEEVYSSFKNLNHFPLISLRIERGDWKKPLQSDKNLIGFVLTKLLDNAFHYFASHKQEKYIKVSWSQTNDTTTIAVEDNGLGIDDLAREKIFQLFYVASDIHGTGLGLFLAQMAANRLGGRIILARSAGPTIFKLIISTNLAKKELEERPVMTLVG